MKKIYSLFAAVILAVTVNAQSVFYSENVGTPAGTTTIVGNMWQVGAPVIYTGTADVRNTLTSTGYTGSSAGGNVLFNASNENLIIAGIDSRNYSDISLSFGQVKGTNASTNELTVEVSADGTTWTFLTYTREIGNNAWRIITPTGTIPSTENLRIRFNLPSATGGIQFRIDDIILTGNDTTLATGSANVTKVSLVKNTSVTNEILFASKSDIQIINMNGQVVKTASVNENSSLEVSTLPKGIYIVTGTVNGKSVSQKIMKK